MPDVFRCAYCGTMASLSSGTIWWVWVETLADGSELYAPGVYCCSWCGQQHSRGSVGRG